MQPARRSLFILPESRVRLWYGLLLAVCCLFIVRLFYLQIIKHDYYKQAAFLGQFKEYEVPAERGVIDVHDGDKVVPIVLNEKLYTLFADPKFITDAPRTADAIARIVGGSAADYQQKMQVKSRYAVLAKKLPRDKREQLDKLEIKGIGTREESYRTYPQGELAAQVLGFVNDEGEGKYGIEQALDTELRGQPGQLKAITDARGVPLVANKDNIVTAPHHGQRLLLTLDISMQQQVGELLKAGLAKAQSKAGSALVMEANSGAVKAMVNWPSYNPAEFFKVEDGSVFANQAVSGAMEIGSVMKPLTAAAALNEGAVQPGTTYFDPAKFTIDEATIRNIEEDGGPGTRSVQDILQLSLNTGATWLVMQMGGGSINEKARVKWHDYMVNHYRFGQTTGIEQGYESDGVVPSPTDGFGLNIQYANTSFGQGMTATPIQVAAAMAAAVNGGTFYQPRLVDTVTADGKTTIKQPVILRRDVVKAEVSTTLRQFMEHTVTTNNPNAVRTGYAIGGKTGTAQIARPEGGYYEDRYMGNYVGYVGGDKPQYIIFVKVAEPKVGGYASRHAQPIFAEISNLLINAYGVVPKSGT